VIRSSGLSVLLLAFLLGGKGFGRQTAGQDDKILERGEKLLEEAKASYEDARTKSSVAAFVDAGFKLEEARIKFIVLQEIGSPEKQKIATDRMRAINQLSKLIHDGKVAISGSPGDSAAAKPTDAASLPPSKDPASEPLVAAPAPAIDVTTRAPVPDAAKQKETERLLKDLFKDQYAKKAAADKQILARTLLDQARRTKDDPVTVWVTCREAQDLAAQVCDVKTLIAAIEETARVFDIDALPMKSAALATAGKAAKSPEELASMVMALDRVFDELMAADQYDSADKAATSALQYARRTNDAKLLARATARVRDVTEAKARYLAMKNVLQTLARTPDDPGANLEMGQFLCFVKGNWDLGLRFLVKGSDATMKSLTEKELALPANAADRTAVGDGWYELAEKEKVPYRKNQLLAHSRTLYEGAVDDAAGLARMRIEKRLELIQNAIGASPVEVVGGIDLLKLVDAKRDAVAGEWSFQGGVLESPKDRQFNRIQILYSPGSEYDLVATVERKEEASDFVLGLVGGNRQFAVQLDAWESQVDYSGINLIDGKYGCTNEGVYKGRVLPQDKRSTVICAVRKTGVTVTVDGKRIIAWKGDFGRLSLGSNMAVPSKESLFVGSWGARFRITQLSLTPRSGEGRVLR
jgi:hypothetical protein